MASEYEWVEKCEGDFHIEDQKPCVQHFLTFSVVFPYVMFFLHKLLVQLELMIQLLTDN